MQITINGESRETPDGSTCFDVLESFVGTKAASQPAGIALALNGAVVPRSQWSKTEVPAGAELEIVTAVQGG